MLITVEKNGERMEIHPETLDEHVALGWAAVADEAEQDEEAPKKTSKKRS